MEHILVLECGAAGCTAADIIIPCTHGPACCIVGIQRDGVGLFLDSLQGRDEFIGRLGEFSDAGFGENALVVHQAVCTAGGRNAVAHAVISLGAYEVVQAGHGFQIAQRDEVLGQFVLIHSRNAHDGPVGVADTQESIFCIVRDQLIFDLNVRIGFVELLDIAGQFSVLAAQVGAVIGKMNLGRQIGVLTKDDFVKGGQCFFR